MDEFFSRGWVKFPFDPAVAAWAAHADEAALEAEAAPDPQWLRCGGTWFVGVNALANDGDGRLPGGPPLAGAAFIAARALSPAPLDRAQASVCYAGYPRQGAEESAAAFRYRIDQDAAHVDGLHRIMPGRRRMLKETHAYILGLPLNDAPPGAAPFTVWEGSHEAMRAAFRAALAGVPPSRWGEVDLTETYQNARRRCFETMRRVEIAARPGEAYLIHRLALHGVARWSAAGPGRRAIAYFRPDPGVAQDWLDAP